MSHITLLLIPMSHVNKAKKVCVSVSNLKVDVGDHCSATWCIVFFLIQIYFKTRFSSNNVVSMM